MPGAGVADVARLGSVIASMDAPVAIVIDHADALVSRECHDMVAELAVRLPVGSAWPSAPARSCRCRCSRLRVHGRLVEVGTTDLAMTSGEARALLQATGVELADPEVDALVERTEGWAAGLYLAALATKAGGSPGEIATSFTGDDRFVADYLRSEFLDHVSRADVSFLTRTSILERMSGPLCDVTVGTKRSATGARPARAQQPLAATARPARGVVPLPPPVPRAPARRAGTSGAGDAARAPHPRRLVVRAERPAGSRRRPRPAGGGRRSGGPPRAPAGQPGLGQRPGRHGPALDRVVLRPRLDQAAPRRRGAPHTEPTP